MIIAMILKLCKCPFSRERGSGTRNGRVSKSECAPGGRNSKVSPSLGTQILREPLFEAGVMDWTVCRPAKVSWAAWVGSSYPRITLDGADPHEATVETVGAC